MNGPAPSGLSEISDELLSRAWDRAATQNISIMEGLRAVSGWSADQMLAALSRSFGYSSLSIGELQTLVPDFDAIPFATCAQRGVLLGVDGSGVPYLVMTDPFDGAAEEWALGRLGETTLVPRVAVVDADDLKAYFTQQERQLRAMDGFASDASGAKDEEVAAVISLATINDDSSAVVKLVHSTIYDALKLGASDIHLECDAGRLHVSYRIDGVLVAITQVQSQDLAEQIISRVKVMAELDIAERRIPQDGRFRVRVNDREVDFRVSVMPNIFGEDAVLRLLDRQSLTETTKALRLDSLGLDAGTIGAIRRLASKPHGMLLVTGPTGSGKTTTLYAAITEIHTGRDKIVTIEDPVEYRLPRVLQIPVNEKKGLTFARGLRSILRHDPDKIMVGEIRDDETAQIAVQAALTGHLVFTTVHANTVFDVLGRFVHMGVDPYSFSAALNGIVAQRLLRLNCVHCAIPVAPSDDELLVAGLTRDKVVGWQFAAGAGCGHCRGVGYKGRRAVAEVLVLDDAMRELIAARAPVSSLRERASTAGVVPLREVALRCVALGETTLEELSRVAG